MRSFDDSRGMTFLLSLAALPLAACPSDDSDATASATEDSTGADDDDDDGNTMSASMTEPDPDSSSSGPGTMTDPTESTGPDPTESTGPDPTESSTGDDPTTSTESGSESGSSDTGSSSDDGLMETDSDTESSTTGGGSICPEDVDMPDHCEAYGASLSDCFYEGMYADIFAEYCACNLLYFAEMDNLGCPSAFEEWQVCMSSNDCDTINAGECYEELVASDEACEFIELES
jgi:hypothetical protein